MRKKDATLLSLTAVSLLTACTTGNESFSTEPGQGSGWKSMAETNALIQGKEASKTKVDEAVPMTTKPDPFWIKHPIAQTFLSSYTSLDGVSRVPEQYLRVWFAPYQDKFGNFHEACAVQTVVRAGQWVLQDSPSFT